METYGGLRMTLYSKNGSIPKPETDGTPGWIEVPEPPFAAEGLEVVWWYPPGWVVRPVAPGPDWSWSQSQGEWVSPTVVVQLTMDVPPAVEPALPSGNVSL